MTRYIYILIFTFISALSFGQISFDEFHYQEKGLTPLSNGTVNHADFNGDGKIDLLTTGIDETGGYRTFLYFNDGLGNFTKTTVYSGLPSVGYGVVDVSDFDNDGDNDLFIFGYISNSTKVARFYKNNGNGVFTLSSDFSNNFWYDNLKVEFRDLDHDGDEDLFFTNSGTSILWNAGNGVFVYDSINAFEQLVDASFDFTDVDKDGDDDVVIMGRNSQNRKYVYIYSNDGIGFFSKRTGSTVPFRGTDAGDIAFIDVNNDSHMDIFYTGRDFFDNLRSRFYLNNGTGDFSETGLIRIADFDTCIVQIADMDSDGFNDIVLYSSGLTSRYFLIYKNDGQSDFNSIANGVAATREASLDIADINNDGSLDITHMGIRDNDKVTRSYFNVRDGSFVIPHSKPDRGLGHSSLALSDIDGDNDLDLITSGDNGILSITRIYKNNGLGDFTFFSTGEFPDYANRTDFFDIDNDGDEDLIMANSDSLSIFRNNGSGLFSKTAQDYIGLNYMDFDFGDLEGNGYTDFVMSGLGSDKYTRAYINNSVGAFQIISGGLPGHYWGDIKLLDADQDGDIDVLVTGTDNIWANEYSTTDLMLNDGTSNFTVSGTQAFLELRKGEIAIGDIDGDSDDDVIMTGLDNNDVLQTYLYKNRGNAVFQRIQNVNFPRMFSGNIELVDLDNDNDLDLFLSGSTSTFGGTNSSGEVYIYENDGLGNFTPIIDQIIDINATSNGMAIGDINGDGFKDLVIGGFNSNLDRSLSFYFNTSCSNTETKTIESCKFYHSPSGKLITNSGTYTDSLINRFGCDSVLTLLVTINKVDTSIIDSTYKLISNANENLVSFQWLDCLDSLKPIPNEFGKQLSPEDGGIFAVEINQLNCIDTSSCYKIFGISIEEVNVINTVIYPNPSSENIHVLLDKPYTNLSYTLYDEMSKKIKERALINVSSFTLEVEGLVSGLYFLKISAEGKNSSKRILIK